MTDLDFDLASFRLSLADKQAGGVVVQNGGLLGVGEAEFGDGAGGGYPRSARRGRASGEYARR
jgi:hypothetical protein